MQFDENTEIFIKNNIKLLSSKTQNQIQKIKRQKNDFWRKLKGTKIPKNPDLAIITIQYLINKNKIKNQEDLDDLLKISDYLQKFLYVKDITSISEGCNDGIQASYSKTFLSSKDLRDLKNEKGIKKKTSEEYDFHDDNLVYDFNTTDDPQILRNYGYDILINRFEPFLRKILINEVLIINYGLNNWTDEIPKGVIQVMEEELKNK